MQSALFEHVNVTVTNPDRIAEILCQLFNWHVRWSGPAKDNGYTVHVGSDSAYLALYTPNKDTLPSESRTNLVYDHKQLAHINHLGFVVDSLDDVEKNVLALGFDTFNHGNYEPGRRFYFMLAEGIEAEVVSYN